MSEFVIVEWPDVKLLTSKDGFNEHCHPVETSALIENYGEDAYFVEKYWLEEVIEGMKDPKIMGTPNICFSVTDSTTDNLVRKFQRITRGFDDSELWNLYITIAKFISPRLKEFIRQTNKTKCVPCTFVSYESWRTVLEKIDEAFEKVANIDEDEWGEEEWNEIEQGIKFFSQYFFNLWD